MNIRDPLVTLAALFRRGPFSYPDAADVNDDGHIDVMDALASLEFIFRKAEAPPPPFPTLGPDPCDDRLGCRRCRVVRSRYMNATSHPR